MCDFCEKYQELKIIDPIRTDDYSYEKRNILAGLVLQNRISVVFNNKGFSTSQNHIEGVFELNYCPECGRAIKEKQDEI